MNLPPPRRPVPPRPRRSVTQRSEDDRLNNTVSVNAMRGHIDELLAPYTREDLDDGMQIRWLKRVDRARVIRDLDGVVLEIQIAPVCSAISYAVALHELGHICGRYQNSPNSMTRERWAWQWARSNARKWTPRRERCAVQSLARIKTGG